MHDRAALHVSRPVIHQAATAGAPSTMHDGTHGDINLLVISWPRSKVGTVQAALTAESAAFMVASWQ